jgi:hypothetical protein
VVPNAEGDSTHEQLRDEPAVKLTVQLAVQLAVQLTLESVQLAANLVVQRSWLCDNAAGQRVARSKSRSPFSLRIFSTSFEKTGRERMEKEKKTRGKRIICGWV